MMKKAFTLVELLVAIGIMAVVMGFALVALGNTRATSRDAQRKADLQSIRSALELYRSDNGRYPTAIGQSDIGSYLSSIPVDPISTNTYAYSCLTPSCGTYQLCSTLEVPPDPPTVVACGSVSCGASCYLKLNNP